MSDTDFVLYSMIGYLTGVWGTPSSRYKFQLGGPEMWMLHMQSILHALISSDPRVVWDTYSRHCRVDRLEFSEYGLYLLYSRYR